MTNLRIGNSWYFKETDVEEKNILIKKNYGGQIWTLTK